MVLFDWYDRKKATGPHNNCSTLKRLVAKITVGISRGGNCSAKIFIGCYLKFKLNLANTQSTVEIWLNATVSDLTLVHMGGGQILPALRLPSF